MNAASHIEWLKNRSMLVKYKTLAQSFAGKSAQWQYPFGHSRPEDALALSSVWFAAYPDSVTGRQGTKVLEILGVPELHQTLSEIGIQAVHTGPVKRSGSLAGTEGKAQAWQINALNFSKSPVEKKLKYADLKGDAKALWSSFQGASPKASPTTMKH